MFREYLAAYGATVAGARSAKSALTIARGVCARRGARRFFDARRGWSMVPPRATSVGDGLRERSRVRRERERSDQPDAASGFAGYFLKPVDLDALVRTLPALPRRAS